MGCGGSCNNGLVKLLQMMSLMSKPTARDQVDSSVAELHTVLDADSAIAEVFQRMFQSPPQKIPPDELRHSYP